MYESERVVENLLFASTYCDRWTSATKNEALERSKKTVSAPTVNATARSCHMVSAPSHQATGIVASAAARTTSATIMFTRRCSRRSIQTPAGNEKSRCGSHVSEARIPTSSAEASSARIAVSGIASALIWSPKTEMLCPIQNRTKSGCLVRGCGNLLPRPGRFDPDGDRHRPRRA